MATDYDSPWKEAISLYFDDFLGFFFPDIHADIDWSELPQFLESELQALTREAEHGRRHADSLVPDEASNPSNPFSWLTAAHLHAQATRRRAGRRAETKFRLVRGLYQCGLAKTQVLESISPARLGSIASGRFGVCF